MTAGHDDLVTHLVASTGMGRALAVRVLADVVAYFSETTEGFVRRRHRELQAEGRANAEIFGRIGAELAARPVAPPALSARQLRRIVYG